MKKTIFIIGISLLNFVSYGQTMNYSDLGALFSERNHIGTARYAGLNGAMGAVGGDISAIEKNPAALGVFSSSEFNISVGINNFKNTTNFYNNKTNNNSSDITLNQLGLVLVFDDLYNNQGWNKVNFSVNYQTSNNFHARDIYSGNSGFGSFNTHPNDIPTNEYNNTISQRFTNHVNGELNTLKMTLAGQYEENFYGGIGLNFHDLSHSQSIELNELSNDNDGNTLDALLLQNSTHRSDGLSLSIGFIYKPIHEFRFGLAFETPTWFYNMSDEFNETQLIAEIPAKNINAADPINNDSFYEYQLQTPATLTASSAIVVGKSGFINLDYTYKMFSPVQESDNLTFTNRDNQYYDDVLQNTHNFNLGSEFKLGMLHLRGGIGYSGSPFKDNVDAREIDVLKIGEKISGALGIGFRIGNSKLDFAYTRSEQTNEYDFYDQYSDINTAKIDNNNSSFVSTFTYVF